MNTNIDASDVPTDRPDGSTNVTDEQKEYTEQLADGSQTDAGQDGEHDTVSGGDADDE